MQPLTSQLRYIVRKLARSPVFTVVSIVTLALGIGANAAIFSVVNGVLLKPLPFEDHESLVGVWHTAAGLGFDNVNQSPALYFTYRDESQVFEESGMWDNTQVSVTGLEEPEQVEAMLVTDGVLLLLRIRPFLGRAFTAEDDSPDSPRTVILGYGYWQTRFGGDPSAIGRTLRINGRTREIIGVMPADFRFLRFDPALYLPFQFDRSEVFVGNFSYQGIARLKAGITMERANQDVARMVPMAVEQYPGGLTLGMLEDAQFGPNVHPLKQDVVGDVGNVLWVLLGTVGLVLLIACANVTNLFLVRAEARQREVAVRSAMGASRGRIAREFLAESVVLGILGGVAGLGLAYGGMRVLLSLAPDNLPRASEIAIDPIVLLFTLGISVFAGLLFGVIPVLHYGRPNLVSSLKEGGRGNSAGAEKHRMRNLLAVSQVALASVLLIGSGLMIRSFQALRNVNPGFQRPEEVLTVGVSLPQAEIVENEEAARAHELILQRLEQIPGVTSVAASSAVTMDGRESNDPIFVEGVFYEEDQIPPIRRFKWIAGEYFQTMENPILAGRSITWADIHTRAPVAVITENLARQLFGDAAASIGKRIRQWSDAPWREVVGVVGNVRDDGVSQDVVATVYWPMAQEDFWDERLRVQRSMVYVIRTARPLPTSLLPEVRQAVWAVNPNLPLANVRTLDEILARSMARTSFTLVMLGIAAAVAIILGAIGLYGVISYTVSQRTREIGVRMALGAKPGDVSRMVLRQGSVVAAVGVVSGLLAAVGLTRLMSALLYGVNAIDPITYGAAALGVAGVALLASYIPARRAAGVDPNEALKWE